MASRAVDFTQFVAIAGLSERVVALDGWLRRCLASLDIIALHHKISRAKALFFCNDPYKTVFFDFKCLTLSESVSVRVCCVHADMSACMLLRAFVCHCVASHVIVGRNSHGRASA